jgi:hypothetical protein
MTVTSMTHVPGMTSIYETRLVTLMLVISLASRHVSGITRLVSGITRLVSGITRHVSGITRLVSGITSLTFNASVTPVTFGNASVTCYALPGCEY